MYVYGLQKENVEWQCGRGPEARAQEREFPEVGCFFGYELFSVAKNTLFTRKHLPYLGNLKHCKARK